MRGHNDGSNMRGEHDSDLPRLKHGMIVRFRTPINFGAFSEKIFKVVDGNGLQFLAGGEENRPCRILSTFFRTTPFEVEDPAYRQCAASKPGEQLSLF